MMMMIHHKEHPMLNKGKTNHHHLTLLLNHVIQSHKRPMTIEEEDLNLLHLNKRKVIAVVDVVEVGQQLLNQSQLLKQQQQGGGGVDQGHY